MRHYYIFFILAVFLAFCSRPLCDDTYDCPSMHPDIIAFNTYERHDTIVFINDNETKIKYTVTENSISRDQISECFEESSYQCDCHPCNQGQYFSATTASVFWKTNETNDQELFVGSHWQYHPDNGTSVGIKYSISIADYSSFFYKNDIEASPDFHENFVLGSNTYTRVFIEEVSTFQSKLIELLYVSLDKGIIGFKDKNNSLFYLDE